MATLLELYTIEANSRLGADAGEPAEVTAARQFRQRVRAAVIKAANAILASQADLPTDPEARTAELERISWARGSVQSPELAADVALRLALAANAGLTVGQILGAGDAGDAAIENRITSLIPRLAKGLHPSR